MNTCFEPPPLELKLLSGEVHIWVATLVQPLFRIGRYEQMLSDDEKKRAQQFHFEKDKRDFIVGRGMLRSILRYYLIVRNVPLKIEYGCGGKPVLVDAFDKEPVHFNLSHSHGVALIALARSREVGVDVEYIRDIPEMGLVVEQFFSIHE